MTTAAVSYHTYHTIIRWPIGKPQHVSSFLWRSIHPSHAQGLIDCNTAASSYQDQRTLSGVTYYHGRESLLLWRFASPAHSSSSPPLGATFFLVVRAGIAILRIIIRIRYSLYELLLTDNVAAADGSTTMRRRQEASVSTINTTYIRTCQRTVICPIGAPLLYHNAYLLLLCDCWKS